MDWSNSVSIFNPGGRVDSMRGSASLMRLTISMVDAPPFLSAVSSAPRSPLWRTMLVCTI